jgi:hypothetical protein
MSSPISLCEGCLEVLTFSHSLAVTMGRRQCLEFVHVVGLLITFCAISNSNIGPLTLNVNGDGISQSVQS